MADHPLVPRKQRRHEHVIADLAVHHVEGFVLRRGYTAHRVMPDYGYDLILFTYDSEGFVEPGLINVQVKATEVPERVGDAYAFDVDIKDYNLWIGEVFPVILVLYDVPQRVAVWLHVQGYFAATKVRRPQRQAKSIRVSIPASQRVSLKAIATIRVLKLNVFR